MSDESTPAVSKGMRWAGYVLTALPVLMLLFSASGKFLKPEGMEANVEPLGWRMDQMTLLGIVETACVIIYLIPQTAVFGAVLLTAYLGGATATHARIGDPIYFPIIVGIFVWVGLYLREPRLWPLAPFRK
ncbi:MAG: DoxX family protein [Pyrinomonadaceae bacterium]